MTKLRRHGRSCTWMSPVMSDESEHENSWTQALAHPHMFTLGVDAGNTKKARELCKTVPDGLAISVLMM